MDDPQDDDDEDDRVDRIRVVQNFSVSENFSLPTNYFGEIGGHAQLELSFLLICPVHYFGSDCTTFCVERDDEFGHFVCDTNGNIVCREGYQNPASNCTECTLPQECSKSAAIPKHSRINELTQCSVIIIPIMRLNKQNPV